MKIKTKSKKKGPVIILTILALVFVAGFLLYYSVSRQDGAIDSPSTTQKESPKMRQNQSVNTPSSGDAKSHTQNTDHPPEPSYDNKSNKKRVGVVASTDRLDNMVYIRGGINYPVTEGTCFIQLSGPAGQSIRKDSTILQNPASTDCRTISIPVNELVSGRWSFILYYSSSQYEGESDEVSFSL